MALLNIKLYSNIRLRSNMVICELVWLPGAHALLPSHRRAACLVLQGLLTLKEYSRYSQIGYQCCLCPL